MKQKEYRNKFHQRSKNNLDGVSLIFGNDLEEVRSALHNISLRLFVRSRRLGEEGYKADPVCLFLIYGIKRQGEIRLNYSTGILYFKF